MQSGKTPGLAAGWTQKVIQHGGMRVQVWDSILNQAEWENLAEGQLRKALFVCSSGRLQRLGRELLTKRTFL